MKNKSKALLPVLKNTKLNSTHFVLTLQLPDDHPEIWPGQFVEVLVEGSPQTFLRRPISVHDVDETNHTLDILVKIVGAGTEKLSQLHEGDQLDIVYPLGHGFSLARQNQKVLLAGGGCGVAPMLYLARKLKEAGADCCVAIGGKTSADILTADAYSKLAQVAILTEDGSKGDKGMITAHPWFGEKLKSFSKVYVCGPDPMMKAIGKLATDAGVYCEVSLENLMACGIGSCLCCTVSTHEGNVRACMEGPVFDVTQLKDWNHNPVCHG
jgi:dihydroorotate dehydrogenase electron transfer subunit